MAPKVERVLEGFKLGEGPHWDEVTQTLYLVDIPDKSIHKYVPATKEHTKASVDQRQVSLIVPVASQKDEFLISADRDLVVVTWDGVSDKVSIYEKIAEVDTEPENLANKLNDGKCDPSGRLWTGTCGKVLENLEVEKKQASFYSLDNGKIKKHVTNIGISNGLAWAPDAKSFYYIDSATGTVQQFDFDNKNGTLSNGKVIFTLSKHNIEGFLDGMTIDTDGNLWIAVFNGSKVIQIDPRKSDTILQIIELPAKQPTSVTFGGPNLDELYVTSGTIVLGGVELPPPDNGALFKVTGLGVKGCPGISVKL